MFKLLINLEVGMNDSTRAIWVLLAIVIIFGLSYWGFHHIDNSYMMNEPEHVTELEAAVDSLTTVTVDLEKRNKELQEGIDNLKSDDDEKTEENKEIVDE